ncbi:MAG: ester cyclase [Ardenticatenaceae bacterium]|nr:ester cyclase [Ardenticatenaceae bacterium]
MSAEANKTVIRELWEGFNTRNLDVFIDLAAPEYVNHAAPAGAPTDREGWKMLNQSFIDAFPDIRVHELATIATDNHVVGRFRLTGTHQGTLMGMPATNKSIDVTAMMMLSIQEGQVMARWEEFDTMKMMQQLGYIPMRLSE